MEAYIIENEAVLALDGDTFANIEIVVEELALKQGRKSKDTDGRIDILATYSQEYIAVVELKLGQLDRTHLKQLEDYLEGKQTILMDYPEIFDSSMFDAPKWIGVLVGTSIDADLANQLCVGYRTASSIPIAALTLQRFRSTDGDIFVTTDTYFKNTALRDTTQYVFNGEFLGKGRLVLAVVKRYVEDHPNITFSALENAFPKGCQGSYGVFALLEDANEIYSSKGRKRHFIELDERISLADCTIAICSQWGKTNIAKFIDQATKNGCSIDLAMAPE